MIGQAHDAGTFYVWFDTEYSSLDVETAVLLQVAALVTDTSLRRVLPQQHDVRLIIRPPEGTKFSRWVEQNLPDLVRACRSAEAVDVAEADDRLAAFVDAVVGSPQAREDHRPVLAGNTIHADWWLIRRFLPRFLARLHYRQLDVSAFKLEWKRLHPGEEFRKENPEIIRTYFPEAVLPVPASRHDAYYDLQASIAELAFYRQHLFRLA
jgi:oligoribonuclease